jgi:hypothetical protein
MTPKTTASTIDGAGSERLKRLAPYLLLGPITGPFTAGIVLNFRGGRPVLGSLYAIALAGWWVLAPLYVARMIPGWSL